MPAYMRRKSAMAKYQRKKCTHQRISSYNNIRVYRMAYTVRVFIYIIRCHAAIMQAPRVRAIGSTVKYNDMYSNNL